jgi:hypothetical protein
MDMPTLFDKLRSNDGCNGLRENQPDKGIVLPEPRHSGATVPLGRDG